MTGSTTPPPDDVPDRFAVDFTGLTLLGVYAIENKRADGGMGSVYVGRDTSLGRPVVVKVPHVRFLGDRSFRGRFRREISELVRLEHPHIVRILAQGEHDGVPFFVLQYLGGGSLDDVLRGHEGPQGLDALASWLPTIAETLDFVHERGTVHRDVKPGNVLFDQDGHVYLSDFGVAKTLESEDMALTEAGTGIGSPRYMAPEQAVGAELTPAADQYALAAMAYEALAGRPPFGGRTPVEVLVAKQTGEPDPLASAAPDVPSEAAAAVMRGLSRDPANRFPTCRDFAAAVLEPTRPAPPPPPPHRVGPAVWALAGAGVLVAVLLAVSFTGGFRRRGSAPPPAAGGATDETPSMRLVLLDPGDEPRRALRYRVDPGLEERVTIDLDQHTSFLDAGESADEPDVRIPAWAQPAKVLDVVVKVAEVGSQGDLQVEWRVEKLRFRGAKETPPELLKVLENLSAGYAAFTGTAVLSANGLTREASLSVGPDVSEVQERDMTGLFQGIRSIVVPLPKEPVGPGARWEITETADLMGLRVTHANTVTLVERDADGDEISLDVQVAQTAPRQPLPPVFGDVEATVTSLHASGSATSHADLTHVVPDRFAYDATTDLAVAFDLGERVQSGRLRIHLKMQADRE